MTTQNAGEMTVEECRDWLADKAGWVKVKGTYGEGTWRHRSTLHDPCSNWGHPIPETLDEAARLPEGWLVEIEINSTPECACKASQYKWNPTVLRWLEWSGFRVYSQAETELLARFRLRVAVEMAENERSKA